MDPEGGAAVAVEAAPGSAPATPAHRLQELEQQAAGLKAQHEALRAQLAAAAAAAAAQLAPGATGLPLPEAPEALAAELTTLHAARQYLQYLQELQALTRHAEKLARAAERALAETADVDPFSALRDCSDAVDAFSHAMGYAIALEQLQEQGGLAAAAPALGEHGSSAIARVDAAGAALRGLLSAAAQASLRRCAWPPPVVGEGDGAGGGWDGFEASAGEAAASALQHLFIIQLTLQRAIQHKEFAALAATGDAVVGSSEPPLLWPAAELAAGVGAWLRHHFAEGLPTDRPDRPEWLFAAALKAARTCAPAAEELQPAVDAHQLQQWYSLQLETARAVGAAAVAPLLRGHVLPRLASLGDPAAWLHFVDAAVDFERGLAPLRGVPAVGAEDPEAIPAAAHADSVLEVLFEQEDWGANGWLAAEATDAERQIDAAVDAPDAWAPALSATSAVADLAALALGGGDVGGGSGGAGTPPQAAQHEFYPPACAEAAVTVATALARRQGCLFAPQHRAAFTGAVIVPVLKAFRGRLGALLLRAEQFDHLLDEAGLPRVGAAICAAHYVEHALREPAGALLAAIAGDEALAAALEREAASLATFRRQWAYKVAKLGVEGFQARFETYKQGAAAFAGGDGGAPPQGPSPTLLPSADGVNALLRALAAHLDAVVFRDVWRAVALAVNYALFNDIATEATFSAAGAAQLSYDVDALVGVFGTCTTRPAAHFKEAKEACRLLGLDRGEAAVLAGALAGGGAGAAEALNAAGIKALNVEQAASVLARRADLAVGAGVRQEEDLT